MKKTTLLSLIVATAMTISFNVQAQQISVVTPDGSTSIYSDLNLAIQAAAAGSTLYLSGGGFQTNDSVKISKRLTIIGIGHKANNDNADGYTSVSGNLFFVNGSDNSAVMGIYLVGNVSIGTDNEAVNNFLLRYCNINAVTVGNRNCQSITINQNYLRGNSICNYAPVTFTNNILYNIYYVNGGKVDRNVIIYGLSRVEGGSQITNNINIDNYYIQCDRLSNNTGVGENAIVVENWDDVFVGPNNGVTPSSDFSLKPGPWKTGATDGGEIGIYGGSGFSDKALPPIPRIVDKRISDQTDENGKLKISVRVEAK